MVCDAYDFWITIFIGFTLGVFVAWILADVQRYYRSNRP
jgi:Na+/H+-dicarboxylate symporter